jgi:imidazolonepropionase
MLSLCADHVPLVQEWWGNHAIYHELPFVDVFCEKGVFDLAQSRRILSAAAALGFPLKIHADEFENIGGANLAAELKAVSADHLVTTSAEDILALAQSDTVAVALPCTPFGLAESIHPARENLEGGWLLASPRPEPGPACGEEYAICHCSGMPLSHLTPAQAIVAATINAAAAIARSNRIGSLEPGKQADLIILDIPDYRHLGYRFGTNLVQIVIKKGKFYPN